MFSAEGIAAITFSFGFSRAMARIAASMVAAPAMSDFIHSIPFASLIDSPPESNVIPLPLRAIGAPVPPPEYRSSISLGWFSLPRPTPRIPPKPPRWSSVRVSTLTWRPTSRAIFRASCARKSGVASSAGVLTRSRAHAVASARISARRIASRPAGASVRAVPSTTSVRHRGPSPSFTAL